MKGRMYFLREALVGVVLFDICLVNPPALLDAALVACHF
jgi:hypothetical protein